MSKREPSKKKRSDTKDPLGKKGSTSLQRITVKTIGGLSQGKNLGAISTRESMIKSFNQQAVDKYATSYKSKIKMMDKLSTGWSSNRAAYEESVTQSARALSDASQKVANLGDETSKETDKLKSQDLFKYASG